MPKISIQLNSTMTHKNAALHQNFCSCKTIPTFHEYKNSISNFIHIHKNTIYHHMCAAHIRWFKSQLPHHKFHAYHNWWHYMNSNIMINNNADACYHIKDFPSRHGNNHGHITRQPHGHFSCTAVNAAIHSDAKKQLRYKNDADRR